MANFSLSLDRRKDRWVSIWAVALAIFLLVMSAEAADKTQADYFVQSLPGQPDGELLKMHAGHIEITPEHNGNLFFWLHHNRHIGDRQRTVIWLNGGPGCSSMDGALMEIGPYRVREGGKLEYNEGSWDEFANLLFVDNPVGTGFSYVNTDSYVHELQEMADQFVIFMEKWFALFPEFENDDLYFAGESYAGQHIPYITKTIMDRNAKATRAGSTEWNIKGLLIGNGWISPRDQYLSYLPFAYAEGLIQGGTSDAEQVERQHADCVKDLAKESSRSKVDIYSCEAVLQKVLEVTQKDHKCINMYDIRLTDSYPSCGMAWPPDLTSVTPYLRREDVMGAIHINADKRTGWSECNGAVSHAFRASHSTPAIDILPAILESGMPILLFSGAKDYICNHLGTEYMISKMKWSDGTGMETSPGIDAPKRDWEFEGESAGIYQEARNLTYVLFYDSSHMVPFDLPRRSRDMLDRFMGVDIASIGGKPTDSRIGGEKVGGETSVEGYPNSTAAIEKEEEREKAAELKAYYRAGEAALVVVLIAAAAFGWWVWRGRRRERAKGYMSVPLAKGRDVEAGDFDESELENLQTNGRAEGQARAANVPQYDLASDSEDEDEDKNTKYRDSEDGKRER